MGPNTVEISMVARLSSLLIPVKETQFEKITRGDLQNLQNIC